MLAADTIFTTAAVSLIRQVSKVLIEGEEVYIREELDPIIIELAKSYYNKFMLL